MADMNVKLTRPVGFNLQRTSAPVKPAAAKTAPLDAFKRVGQSLNDLCQTANASVNRFAGYLGRGVDLAAQIVANVARSSEVGLEKARAATVKLLENNPNVDPSASPAFALLPPAKQSFLRDCIESARFWIAVEKTPRAMEGMKFLLASFGLTKAEEEANRQQLQGKAREQFLANAKSVYSHFNPYAC